MKKLVLIALAGALALVGTSAAHAEVGATVIAAGGTPVSNGVFLPGTAIYDGDRYQGPPPVQILQGQDFEFVNLDESALANGHKIQSFKKKRGRPLFRSELLLHPGERDVVVTSHLKPGTYVYYCTVHVGMFGRIQVAKG